MVTSLRLLGAEATGDRSTAAAAGRAERPPSEAAAPVRVPIRRKSRRSSPDEGCGFARAEERTLSRSFSNRRSMAVFLLVWTFHFSFMQAHFPLYSEGTRFRVLASAALSGAHSLFAYGSYGKGHVYPT